MPAKKPPKNSNANSLARQIEQRFELYRAKSVVDYTGLSLLDFIPAITPKFQKPVHLIPIIPYLEAVYEGTPQSVTFSAGPRHGKALADDTPILTNRGWLRCDQVIVGDQVYGSSGAFTEVTGIYPQGMVDLYKISFSDGASIVACGNHKWWVRQRYYDKWYAKTTSELLEDLTENDGRKKWRIPVVSPIEGMPGEYPVDPYILGVWLGDGTSRDGAITTMDDEIRDSLERTYGITRVDKKPDNKACSYASSRLRKALKAAGLLQNKHVPEVYRTAPPQVRLAVLQGLADTDGTVAKNGSQQSICTTSPALLVGIKELICSLGGTYTVVEKPTYAKLAYNVYFRLPDGIPGFRLERKQQRLASFSNRNRPRRFIDSITPVGRGSARCFSVAASDHLYCAGHDFVVTHNSELLFHFIALYIARNPTHNIAFCSYSAKFAERKSVAIRDIVKRCGVELDQSSTAKGTWRTAAGGYFFARGPGGDLTGEGIHLLVCDDPYRSRGEAESAIIRDNIYDWWTSVAMTRLEPGASVIAGHTRWHTDDLTGKLTAEQEWPNVSIPVICENGEALWPERYDLKALARIRKTVGEYDWASMFMCSPRPRGGSLFGNTVTYTDDEFKDIEIERYVIGLDLAYTSKTYSDWSVAVVLGLDADRNAYLVDIRRKQCPAKDFALVLKELRLKYRSPQIIWFTGGQEKAIAEFFRISCGIPVKDIPAKEDKFIRAQAVATAWNNGRVLIPSDIADDEGRVTKPWLNPFLSEVLSFTGVGDAHDDQVDALAAAFHPLATKRVARGTMHERILSF